MYLTPVRFSSLATRSPFVSQVDVLKRAPGITSRVFPACNACQKALTLTDSSSALSIAQKPRTGSHSSTSVVNAPLSISRRYGTNKFSSSTMYFVINEPCTGQLFSRHKASGIRHQASGIRHQASVSIIWYQAVSHQPIVGRRWRAHFRPTILGFGYWIRASQSQRQGGLRSRHHGSVCALPLLSREPAAGRPYGHQGSHEEPPAPAVRRTPSCSSSSLRALSDTDRGFTERTISCPLG